MNISAELLTYRTGYLAGYHAGLADGLAGEDPDQRLKNVGDLPLSYLELSTRVCNCLKAFPCQTVSDVATLPLACIRRIRNLGVKGSDEVARALHRFNLRHTDWDLFLLDK